jgi:hypothetical protein
VQHCLQDRQFRDYPVPKECLDQVKNEGGKRPATAHLFLNYLLRTQLK